MKFMLKLYSCASPDGHDGVQSTTEKLWFAIVSIILVFLASLFDTVCLLANNYDDVNWVFFVFIKMHLNHQLYLCLYYFSLAAYVYTAVLFLSGSAHFFLQKPLRLRLCHKILVAIEAVYFIGYFVAFSLEYPQIFALGSLALQLFFPLFYLVLLLLWCALIRYLVRNPSPQKEGFYTKIAVFCVNFFSLLVLLIAPFLVSNPFVGFQVPAKILLLLLLLMVLMVLMVILLLLLLLLVAHYVVAIFRFRREYWISKTYKHFDMEHI